MKVTRETIQVGEVVLEAGMQVVYNRRACVIVECYDFKGEKVEGYGPMCDLRFQDGSTISQVVPGLDPSFHL